MSRLTLGGRKRAGGKVHERLKQSEEKNENVDMHIEDLQQTGDESRNRSSHTHKYT